MNTLNKTLLKNWDGEQIRMKMSPMINISPRGVVYGKGESVNQPFSIR